MKNFINNYFAYFSLCLLLILFMLYSGLAPIYRDDYANMNLEHFLYWNSRLGEALGFIITKTPIVKGIVMGLGWFLMFFRIFILANKKNPNLKSFLDIFLLFYVPILLIQLEFNTTLLTFGAVWGNYFLSFILFSFYLYPIYQILDGKENIFSSNKYWYKNWRLYSYFILCILTAWSHEVIALLSFATFFYVLVVNNFIKKNKINFGFYLIPIFLLIGLRIVTTALSSRSSSGKNNFLIYIDNFTQIDTYKILFTTFLNHMFSEYIVFIFLTLIITFICRYIFIKNIKKIIKDMFSYVLLLELLLILSIYLLYFVVSYTVCFEDCPGTAFLARREFRTYLATPALLITAVVIIRNITLVLYDIRSSNIRWLNNIGYYFMLCFVFFVLCFFAYKTYSNSYFMYKQRVAMDKLILDNLQSGNSDVLVFIECRRVTMSLRNKPLIIESILDYTKNGVIFYYNKKFANMTENKLISLTSDKSVKNPYCDIVNN